MTTAAKNVTVIPAKAPENRPGLPARKKLRVAAYCRVSSDKDEQFNSFEVQVQHYTETISKNPEWKNAGIFADGYVNIGLNQASLYIKAGADLVLYLFTQYVGGG